MSSELEHASSEPEGWKQSAGRGARKPCDAVNTIFDSSDSTFTVPSDPCFNRLALQHDPATDSASLKVQGPVSDCSQYPDLQESAHLHAVVDGLEVGEGLDRDLGLHLAASGEVKSLDGVLAVSDVGSNDAERLEDGPEDVRLDVRVGRESVETAVVSRRSRRCGRERWRTRQRREFRGGGGTRAPRCRPLPRTRS